MNKFFISIAVVVLALASQACASGFGGYGSLPVVVASNAALPYQILAAGQAVQPFYGAPGYGAVPVCRPEDIGGVSPVVPGLAKPMLIRVEKSERHQLKDIFYGAGGGAGLGALAVGGLKGPLVGAAVGTAGTGYVANHEYDHCLILPAPSP